MRLVERGGTTAVAAGEDVVPASWVRKLEQQVKELQRLVGKQAMTIENLEAAREVEKKVHTCSKGPVGDGPTHGGGLPGAAGGTGHGLPSGSPRKGGFYRRAEDAEVLCLARIP